MCDDLPAKSAQQLEGESGRINGRYAELDWTPIRYIHRQIRTLVLWRCFASRRSVSSRRCATA